MILFLFFASRLIALDALPLHNDEGLHLTRAVEVWNGNPFWEIRDGKIINHWLIALFYPQNAPVLVGRIATVFVALLGTAALIALTRRLGATAMTLAALLWLASPFMFFYDRMAFSDMQAGALGLLALWAAQLSWGKHGRPLRGLPRCSALGRHSGHPYILACLLTAILLALALLFKFTAAPYALGVALIILTRDEPLRARLHALLIAIAVGVAAFAVPIAVLLMRGSNLFDIALEWVGVGDAGGSGGLALLDNLGRLMVLLSWGNPLYLPLLLVGWAGALGWVLTLRATHVAAQDDRAQGGEQVPEGDIEPLRQRVMWVAASAIPMLAILVLGRDAQSRHFAAAMPPLMVLAGIGWAWVVERLGRWNWAGHVTASSSQTTQASSLHRSWAQYIQALALIIPFAAFAWNAYHDPAATNMPPLMAWQYVEGYASGYGLREAVEAFPDTLQERDLTIVGSMYGDSCRRANFYARDARTMLCGDPPMRDAIEEALMRDGAVYVLVERGGEIGINLTTLDARARLIAAYPRPHESADDASVRLWRLER